MKKTIFALLFFTVLLAATSASYAQGIDSQLENTTLPIQENQGQTDSQVEYMAHTLYGTSYITNSSITHAINAANGTIVIREEFLNQDGVVTFQPQGTEPSQAQVSYYYGNNPEDWYQVKTYQTVTLGEIYPGVEVFIRSYGSNLEKIYLISPGASSDLIQVLLKGANTMEIAPNGELLLTTELGTVSLTAPVAYQETPSGRVMVPVNYQLLSSNIYGFQVGEHDHNLPLYIDPKLVYSSFLGGLSTDYGLDVLLDNQGMAYLTGYTYSSDFPTTPGAYANTFSGSFDAFFSIINMASTGTSDLVYSTYLGGVSTDYGYALALDNLGRVYLTGYTNSANFPTTTGAYQITINGNYDAFLSIINPVGGGVSDLVYSTYLGGSNVDRAFDLIVDATGMAYLTGNTHSSNFPTTIGAFQTSLAGSSDAFLTILNPVGSGASDLVYSTYLGGSSNELLGTAITRDATGRVYIRGYTTSTNFPTTSGAYQTSNAGLYDVFMSILNPVGSGASDLVYSTYLGGSSNDNLNLLISDNAKSDIITDSLGRVYLVGTTQSTDFPVTSNAYQQTNGGNYDAFFSIINPASAGISDLVYSTYLGGSSTDLGSGLKMDSTGRVYLVGGSASTNFPVTSDAYQLNNGGSYDAFQTIINPSISGSSGLVYSTYLGGSSTDIGYAIYLDSESNAYIAGTAHSANFPTTSGAYQTINAGSYDVFLSKMGKVHPLLVMGDVTGNKGDTVNLMATLTETNGTALAGQTINFLVNGLNVGSAVTNASGVATLPYTIVLAGGSYPLQAQFAGDVNYFQATASGILVVTDTTTPAQPSESQGTEVGAKTVSMQTTGAPLAGIALAILMVLGGIVSARRK